MKKTITMYELLGMVKDGKAPKKIKVTGRIYEYDEIYDFYYTKSNKTNCMVSLGGMEDEINLIANAFNENVEILDEKEFIDIEEFEEHKLINTRDILELEMFINKINADYNYKINQLIKNQKKIIERINKEN